ncbi:MAG TPA: ParB/RepB/Spo0J family partition protein [Bacillota bacterium]
MSKAKPRLGRGLGAILPEADREPVREIPIGQIRPNPHQPRRAFPDEALQELAASIRVHGIIQPLIVVADGDGFTLVAGERRWRAAQLAGLQRVPALVRELDPAGMTELALIENLQREDLTPIEAAHAFQVLQEEFGLTQEAIAERVGKSRSHIANTLRLLTLDPAVQRLLNTGELTMGHAKLLLSLASAEEQRRLARLTVERGWTVRQLADQLNSGRPRVVRGRRGPTRPAEGPKSSATDADLHWQAAAAELQRILGTRVEVQTAADGGRGRIVVEFYSRDEFDRLYALLCGRPGESVAVQPR